MTSFRVKLAFIIFAVFMVWPLFHIGLVKKLGFSSWRLFGWGMYATPMLEEVGSLRVVIQKKPVSSIDIEQLFSALIQLDTDPQNESRCINLFIEDSDFSLQRLPKKDVCRAINAKNLDYFLHFHSTKHLQAFIEDALSFAGKAGGSSDAYAFFIHQHINLFQKQAYLESDVFKFSEGKMNYLGKINSLAGTVHHEDTF